MNLWVQLHGHIFPKTLIYCYFLAEEFKVGLPHQGSPISPFLFASVMISDYFKQEYLRTMVFADDVVICSESKEFLGKESVRKRLIRI